MTNKFLTLLVLFLCVVTPASRLLGQDFPISLKEAVVPREEMRQQILQGIKEYRYTYSFAKVPFSSYFFAECYTDGKFTRRYLLTTAMPWNKSDYGKGTLSLGWNFVTRELVMINDNGFGLWNSRLTLPRDVFDKPSLVVCAEKIQPEVRETPGYYPTRNTIYPVLGLLGGENHNKFVRKTHFTLTSAADFVKGATQYGEKYCLVIYSYGNQGGGNPPFEVENRTSDTFRCLPMN